MAKTATMTLTFRVTFDPTLTTPHEVRNVVDALVQNMDVFYENGCGTVNVSESEVGAEITYLDEPMSACERNSGNEG